MDMTVIFSVLTDFVLICISLGLYRALRNAKKRLDSLECIAREEAFKADGMSASIAEATGRVNALMQKVEAMEHGMVPDYEKAKDAAKAVNDFSAGISAILGYDPAAVYRKNQGE